MIDEKQPVEKQQVSIDAAKQQPPVLQPGRNITSSDDLIGQLSSLKQKADLENNSSLSAEIQNVQLKIGALLHHLHELEIRAESPVKHLYSKIIKFFKK
jgi:hypothetical protein